MEDIELVAALGKLLKASDEVQRLCLPSEWSREFAASLVSSWTGGLTWKQRRCARRLLEAAYRVLASRQRLHEMLQG